MNLWRNTAHSRSLLTASSKLEQSAKSHDDRSMNNGEYAYGCAIKSEEATSTRHIYEYYQDAIEELCNIISKTELIMLDWSIYKDINIGYSYESSQYLKMRVDSF